MGDPPLLPWSYWLCIVILSTMVNMERCPHLTTSTKISRVSLAPGMSTMQCQSKDVNCTAMEGFLSHIVFFPRHTSRIASPRGKTTHENVGQLWGDGFLALPLMVYVIWLPAPALTQTLQN